MDLLVDFLQLCESSGFIELKLPFEDLKSKVTNHCTASHLTYSFRCTGLFSFFSSICYGVPSSKVNLDQYHHRLVLATQKRRHVWTVAVSQTLVPHSHPSPHPLPWGFLGAIHWVIMGRVCPSPSSLMFKHQT